MNVLAVLAIQVLSITAAAEGFPAQTENILKLFQGSWSAWSEGKVSWSIDVKGSQFDGFLSDGVWYEGVIRVRSDVEPGWLDFQIDDCDGCKFKGLSSRTLFTQEGDMFFVRAPEPGDDRPTKLDRDHAFTVELRRRDPAIKAPPRPEWVPTTPAGTPLTPAIHRVAPVRPNPLAESRKRR